MRWRLVLLLIGILPLISIVQAAAAQLADPAGADTEPDPRTMALRREYNDVTAAIDTLIHVYGADRIARLTDPDRPLLALPADHRLVLLIWGDDEARVYLNGAPVGETRLTPTRIEIPSMYIQQSNELSIHAWDTDRVEAAAMLGFYVEDPLSVLHPVVTTLEEYDWLTEDGQPGLEIFYAHTVPDLPGAQPMWGPKLFGEVWLSVDFDAAQVMAAARAPGLAMPATVTRDHEMDFHRNVGRLLGLNERRQVLRQELEQLATHPDPHLRVRRKQRVSPLTYTLGDASPLVEMAEMEKALEPLEPWRQRLPSEQQNLILREARVLKGPQAATPVEPMESVKAAAERAKRAADYVPPAEQNGVRLSTTPDAQLVRIGGPSAGFLWRMFFIAVALAGWAGLASWRWWLLYESVQWSESGRTG